MREREDISARLAGRRAELVARSRLRVPQAVGRRDGARVEVDGHWLLDFCGNDYLGLSRHFAVAGALADGAIAHGAGGVASHLVCGHHAAHVALEREVADWMQAPAALLMGSGFAANLAVMQTLLGDGDVSVQDRLNHASLIDGARLSGCRLRRYPHADAEGALRQLRAAPGGAALVATDSVFSMDGDLAPLRELAIVARAQRALLYVDEAHAAGVLGPDGRGGAAQARLDFDAAPLRLVTLGKALGSHGAVLVGQADLIAHLAGSARPYVYTTALPPALAASALEAVRIARREHWRRERLGELITRLQAGAVRHGLALQPSQTPIQPLRCGDDLHALAMAAHLRQDGFLVTAIRPPTVPDGSARLRITLSASHTAEQVDGLVDALAAARDHVSQAST